MFAPPPFIWLYFAFGWQNGLVERAQALELDKLGFTSQLLLLTCCGASSEMLSFFQTSLSISFPLLKMEGNNSTCLVGWPYSFMNNVEAQGPAPQQILKRCGFSYSPQKIFGLSSDPLGISSVMNHHIYMSYKSCQSVIYILNIFMLSIL